jgi:hypothetical protein
MKLKLDATLPKICTYFGKEEFNSILKELDHYHKNVKKHFKQYTESQKIWGKICDFLVSKDTDNE